MRLRLSTFRTNHLQVTLATIELFLLRGEAKSLS